MIGAVLLTPSTFECFGPVCRAGLAPCGFAFRIQFFFADEPIYGIASSLLEPGGQAGRSGRLSHWVIMACKHSFPNLFLLSMCNENLAE